MERQDGYENQRREFSRYLELREPEYCYYPLHLDPYGGGCYHNCAYCFQKDQLCFRNEIDQETHSRIATAWRPHNPSVSPIRKIERLFRSVLHGKEVFGYDEIETLKKKLLAKSSLTQKEKKKFAKYCIFKRLPLRVGGVVDPFQIIEKQEGVTYRILELLRQYDYPAQIVTKSAMVASDKYLSLLADCKDNFYVQMTITTLDEKLARVIETNAPSPTDRLAALKRLNENGIHTAVRINPLYPQEIYDIIGESFGDLIGKVKASGTRTLIIGGLRVMSKTRDYGPIASAEFINDSLATDKRFENFDIREVLGKDGGAYYIPKQKLLGQYQKIKAICDRQGLNFTICYDRNENAEDQQFKELWYCQEDCCNGFNQVPNFRTTFGRILKGG